MEKRERFGGMMMNTRYLYFALAAALALCLTACGEKTAVPAETSVPAVTTQETEQPTETTRISVESEETEPHLQEETIPLPPFDRTAVLEETLLYDKEGLKIAAQSLSYEEDHAVLQLRFENQGARDYCLSNARKAGLMFSVNGRFVPVKGESILICMGETVSCSLELPYEMLQNRGIEKISEIAFQLDEGAFSTEILKVTTGETSENFMSQAENAPEVLGWTIKHLDKQQQYYQGDVSHVGTVLFENVRGERFLCLDFQNVGFEVRMVNLEEQTINGLMLLPQGEMLTLFPGEHAIYVLNLHEISEKNHLDLLDVEKLGNLQLKVSVYNQDGRQKAAPVPLNIMLDESIKAFAGAGQLVSEEENLSLSYVGAFPEEEGLKLYFLWENRTEDAFFAQANGLEYNGEKLPVEMTSVRLPEKGWGLHCVTVETEAAKEIEKGSGSFAFHVLIMTGSTRKPVTYEIPND